MTITLLDDFIGFFQGKRLFENLVSSEAETLVQRYNDVFNKLLQDFRDKAAGDTLVVMHRIWEDLVPKVDDLRESFPNVRCHICLMLEMQATQ